MKKLLALLIVAVFASSAIAAEPTKKAPAKKEVKHHKKFEGEKVPEKAPAKAPAKKK
jgi:heat shock protein HslJ